MVIIANVSSTTIAITMITNLRMLLFFLCVTLLGALVGAGMSHGSRGGPHSCLLPKKIFHEHFVTKYAIFIKHGHLNEKKEKF